MKESGVTLEDWRAWHEACALDLAPEGVRCALTGFLGRRFAGAVRRLGQGGLAHRTPGDKDCAHLFETWCCLHQRREGKRYKDWLMTRGDRSQGAVESGVSLLLRKVVLEWVRMEFNRQPVLSLDASLTAETGGLTLEDLLPDPDEKELSFEERRWVNERVEGWVAAMTRVERVAVAARREDRSFVEPGVLRAAGVGKSALHNHFRAWIRSRAEDVKARFPDLPPSESTALALLILEECARKIFLTFSVEVPEAPGCRVMENQDEH
ncbi:MAG: hypothetical protein JJU05_11005 [Verrucomicrobia bacterium]|nr:hypothetical protein [Verrucomicrobiota bacterium]MCH8527377.1 hypothetical protein [Kiritimatiellia bacterium]